MHYIVYLYDQIEVIEKNGDAQSDFNGPRIFNGFFRGAAWLGGDGRAQEAPRRRRRRRRREHLRFESQTAIRIKTLPCDDAYVFVVWWVRESCQGWRPMRSEGGGIPDRSHALRASFQDNFGAV